MDNWPELGRKGDFFFKFELNKVEETSTSVPIGGGVNDYFWGLGELRQWFYL